MFVKIWAWPGPQLARGEAVLQERCWPKQPKTFCVGVPQVRQVPYMKNSLNSSQVYTQRFIRSPTSATSTRKKSTRKKPAKSIRSEYGLDSLESSHRVISEKTKIESFVMQCPSACWKCAAMPSTAALAKSPIQPRASSCNIIVKRNFTPTLLVSSRSLNPVNLFTVKEKSKRGQLSQGR